MSFYRRNIFLFLSSASYSSAIVGSLASGKFYSWFHGNYVLVLALIWVATMLMLLAFVTEVW
jgi:hypothetical protein